MIAAMAEDRVIGLDNKMPWHLPADLAFFKKVTLGKPVIMGRKTHQSIGFPLPGRQNIVLSRDPTLQIEGVMCVQNMRQALKIVQDASEVMIIGGASLYEKYLAQVDCLYLTFIDLKTRGDTYFPDYEKSANWQEITREEHFKDNKNAYNYQFVTLKRIS